MPIITNSWRFISGALIVVLSSVVALIITNEAPPDTAPPPAISTQSLSPVHAYEIPIPLEEAVIWHPADQAYLEYRPINGAKSIRYDWVNGFPRTWELFPTVREDRVFHLVWLNADGVLWRAQINSAGERMLASIRVSDNVDHFTATTLRTGQTLLIWQQNGDVLGEVIDSFGRPTRQLGIILHNVELIDILANPNGSIDATWLSDATLYYGSQDLYFSTPNAMQSQPIDLEADEWLSDLRIIRNGDQVLGIWQKRQLDTPTGATFAGITWDGNLIDIAPDDYRYDGMHRVYSTFPRQVSPYLTTRTWINEQWRATYFIPGQDNLSFIDGPEIVGSAPRLWLALDGELRSVVWLAQDSLGHLYFHAYAAVPPVPIPPEPPTLKQWFQDGLLQLPHFLLWGIAPLVLMIGARLEFGQRAEPLLLLGAYQVAKVFYPRTVFLTPGFIETNRADDFAFNLALILGITALASAVAALLFPVRSRGYMLSFWAFDTCAFALVFGAHLA